MDAGALFTIVGIILTGFSVALIGFAVLWKNPGQNINKTFFATCFFMAIWAFCLLFYEFPIIATSLFWIKATYISVSIAASSLLIFSFIFPKPISRNLFLLALIYAVLFPVFTTVFLISPFSWVVDVVNDPQKGLQTIWNNNYLIWIFFMTVICNWALINFILNQRRVTETFHKVQLKFLFIGIASWEVFVIIADVFVPFIFQDTRLFAISATGCVFFSGAVGYAILRHRFLDLRFALRSIIVHTVLTLLISAIFLIGASIFWYFTGSDFKPGVLIVILGASLLLTLIFGQLLNFSQYIAKKLFFQSVYDYQKTLKDLSLSLSSYLEMPKLADIIIDVLLKTMRLSRVAVLVRDFSDNHYKIQKTIGFDENNGISIVKDNFLTTYLEVHPQTIVLDELKSVIEETVDLNEKDRLEQLYEHMIHIEAALIVPVVNTKRVISLLVLGNKLSSDPYSVQDIDLLHTIASQASIAIENARLYQEVADLNQNLQLKIAEATSELQKKNRDLESAYQDLKVLDKLKDDFVSVVSHELRTPMTAIRSYVWMALKRSDIPLSEKLQKYLSRTLISTERLINLVNDMLNVSRLEAGRIELHPQAFSIWNLINDVLVDITPRAKEKEIEINVFKFPVPSVYADLNKVREVLLNLIGNALKFTPNDGVIDINFEVKGSFIAVSIKDSGVGLSRDDIPRLFQRFGRLDNSYVAAATSGGTGLGLYISKNLVKFMGGEIWATSEGIGTGSTFSFTLPIATQAQVFAPKPQENLVLTQGEIQIQPTII